MKKSIVMIVIALVVVLGLFTGCNSAKSETKKNLETVLNESYISSEQSDTKSGEIVKYVNDKVSYKIIDVNNDICTLEVTYPNIGPAFKELFETVENEPYFTDQEPEYVMDFVLTNVQKKIQENNIEMVTETFITTLVDGVPEISDDILNAFYGNMLSLYTDLISDQMKKVIS